MKQFKGLYIKPFKVKALGILLIVFALLSTNLDVLALGEKKDFDYQTQAILGEDKQTASIALQLSARKGITYKAIHCRDEEVPFTVDPETKDIDVTKEIEENGFYTFVVSYEMEDEHVAGKEPTFSSKTIDITHEVKDIEALPLTQQNAIQDEVTAPVLNDETAPSITGITDGGDSQSQAVAVVNDTNLNSVKLYSDSADKQGVDMPVTDGTSVVTLTQSNTNDQIYKIEAEDKSGNTTSYTYTVRSLTATPRLAAPTAADVIASANSRLEYADKDKTFTPKSTSTYLIANTEDGPYSSSTTYSIEGEYTPTVYLKSIADGTIYPIILERFVLDKTKPKITGVVYGEMLTTSKTITINDANLRFATVYKYGDEKYSNLLETIKLPIENGTATYTFAAPTSETVYYIFSGADQASNISDSRVSVSMPDNDPTAPTISDITFSGTLIKPGYYSGTVTLTPSSNYEIRYMNSVYRSSVLFNVDGVHEIGVFLRRKTDQKVFYVSVPKFTMDGTRPKITGLTENSEYTIPLSILVTDTTLKQVQLVRRSGSYTGAIIETIEVPISNGSASYTVPLPASGTAYYTINAYDNVNLNVSKNFMMTMNGPVASDLTLSGIKSSTHANFFSSDVSITPSSVFKISETRNGVFTSSLTYSANGEHNPTIYLKSNSTNEIYSFTVTKFVIDKTIPTITGETGMSNGGSEFASINKSVTVTDINLASINLYTAASEADLAAAKAVSKTVAAGVTSVDVTLTAAAEDQYFKVEAKDKAGNTTSYKYALLLQEYGISVEDVTFAGLKLYYTQPAAQEIVIDKQTDNASQEATISSVVSSDTNFVVTNSGGKYYIQPIAGLTEGTYTADITVTYDNDATATAQASFTVSREVVTDITGVVSTAIAGESVTLTGTVVPNDASYKTIVWTVEDAGETGATITNGVLTTTDAGTVKVKATIVNGLANGNYTKDFNIVVSRGDSTGLTCPITAATGIPGWYKTDVTVTAPSGYTIATAFGGTYTSSLTYNATTAAPTIFLKEIATGKLYGGKVLADINIDRTLPTIIGGTGMSNGGSEITADNKTVTVADANLQSIDLYTADSKADLATVTAVSQTIAANATSVNVTLTAASKDQYFKVEAKDKAGNKTTYTYTIIEPIYGVNVTDVTFATVKFGYVQPAAKEIAIDTQTDGANVNATIASVTTSTDFVITTKDGKYYIQPNVGLHAGTNEATITVTYDDNRTATSKVKMVVERINNPFTATVADVSYGDPIVIDISNLEGLTESQLNYEYKIAGVYGSTEPTLVGSYTVKITSPKVTDYNAKVVEIDFDILKSRNKFEIVLDDVNYLVAISPTVKNMDETAPVTYSYKVKGSKDNTYTSTVPTNVNEYTVRATSKETAQHAASAETKDFKIKAIDNPFTLTQGDVAYKNKPKPSVSGVEEKAKITYTYKLDGEAAFVSDVPEKVGSYTLKASSEATANYKATEKTKKFEIYPVIAAKKAVLSPEMAQAINHASDMKKYHGLRIDPVDDSAMASIVSETEDLANIQAGTEGTYKVKYTLGNSSVETSVQVLSADYEVDVDGKYAMLVNDVTIGLSKLPDITTERLFKVCNVEVIDANADQADMNLFSADLKAIEALDIGKHQVTLTYGTISKTISVNIIEDNPVTLISLPSGIKVDEIRNSSVFEAETEATISISSLTDSAYFTGDIYITAKPTVKLKNTENDQFFNVQLYSSEEKALNETDNTLMVLNATNKRSDKFYMRIQTNRKNDRGKYKGKIDFEVKYGE